MIANKAQLIKNGQTPAAQKRRRDVLNCLEAGLKAVEPNYLLKQTIQLRHNKLTIKGASTFDLTKFKNIYVVGAGKATSAMAQALENILGNKITAGYINIPTTSQIKLKKIKTTIASHPLPNQAGVLGAKKIAQLLKKATQNDLIIGLISGGGSALLPLPAPDITLSQKIATTKLLLKSSATIQEINTVRKHLSQLKGGQMAKLAYPATLVTLYISDIVGDPLNMIASGPTVPDSSTFSQAINILKKYQLWNKVPATVQRHLTQGLKHKIPENPKNNNQIFKNGKVKNIIIGNLVVAVKAMAAQGNKLGYQTKNLTTTLRGEATTVGVGLVTTVSSLKSARPTMVIAGGETVVNLLGSGQGGRNQELVLAGLTELPGNMTLAALGTDGIDGFTPKPVAGAIADNNTLIRAAKLHLHTPTYYLQNNDSYNFFKPLGEHLDTGGFTGTNVADLIILATS